MVSLGEINERMARLSGWVIEGNSIVKQIDLLDFREAIWFINKIAEIAEKENHHPDLYLSYNVLKIMLKTHSSDTITEKDFAVAEKIDQINIE